MIHCNDEQRSSGLNQSFQSAVGLAWITALAVAFCSGSSPVASAEPTSEPEAGVYADASLGQALRQRRVRQAVSQIEMGRRLSWCPSEVSTVERGFKHITDVRLTRYLAALGTP